MILYRLYCFVRLCVFSATREAQRQPGEQESLTGSTGTTQSGREGVDTYGQTVIKRTPCLLPAACCLNKDLEVAYPTER